MAVLGKPHVRLIRPTHKAATKLGRYRVGHDLPAMDFGGLATVNSGMPASFRVAMNGHPEIASPDPLLHDLFKLGCRLLLLIHAARPFDDDGVMARERLAI